MPAFQFKNHYCLFAMKISSILLLNYFMMSFLLQAFGQCDRWQHSIKYDMEVELNHMTHRYLGKQFVTFKNASPDTLSTLYFHQYYNAFQPGSSMDIRSMTIQDPDRRVGQRISQLNPDEIGFMRMQQITQQGQRLTWEDHETILKVILSEPVLPGKEVTIFMEYDAQVPVQIRRSGRMNEEGIHYSMSQWYPKLCQHDELGWHTNPYIGREFYGIFGEFDVKITIDSSYTIGGTGYLQNVDEIGKGYGAKTKLKGGSMHTWYFKADQVHDFMWAADPEYTHTQTTTKDGIVLRFFYRKNEKTEEAWSRLPTIMARAFEFIQSNYGPYAYRQYAFVQGGDGGMEYPMSTLITGHRGLRSLVGVSVHELMHNWYQGVLAMNEAHYPWMDEGFTSFATEEVMDFIARAGLLPGVEPKSKLHGSSSMGYRNMVNAGIEEPLSTHADHYDLNAAYGISSYSKGALYLHQLGYIIGNDNLRKTLLAFYDRCAFKHPNDNDFRRIAEKVSGLELKWYNEYWVNSIKFIDYAIDNAIEVDSRKTRVLLSRVGKMPMPIDVWVTLNDGSTHIYHIPLDIMLGHKQDEQLGNSFTRSAPWKWTSPKYILDITHPYNSIQSIEIDPTGRLQDIVPENNKWKK